MEKIQERG